MKQLAYLIMEKPEAITPWHAGLLISSLMPWHYATALPLQDDALGNSTGQSGLICMFLSGDLQGRQEFGTRNPLLRRLNPRL